ncbi:uncharacterized protein LOC126896680 [Daktulosphaira vitifoliae]|uniref:uncharacterized protein LOC126896680 n=1 Tax=Daktulosphaira vitifoliae TaxID=58002 RepID=UPI0021AA15B1|nr:uncharacterized protein LOC126896680 [Daktulosphaira vitifoliae]
MYFIRHCVYFIIISIAYNTDILIAVKNIEEFAKLINVIPTWHAKKENIDNKNYDKMLYKINHEKKMNTAFHNKLKGIMCIYSFAIQKIMYILEMFPFSNKLNPIDKKDSNEKKPKERRVRFKNEITLISIDDNDDTSITIPSILKKKPIFLAAGKIRTDSIPEITKQLQPNQEYRLNMFKSADMHYTIPLEYDDYIKLYRKAIGRMISVLLMAAVVPANWIWTIYNRLHALELGKLNIAEFVQNSSELKYNNDFIKSCIANDFLVNIRENDFITNLEFLKKNMKASISYLRNIYLLPSKGGKESELLPLFKYENKVGMLELYWNRTFSKNVLPMQDCPHIESKNMSRVLNKINDKVGRSWKKDPFISLNLYILINNFMQIKLLYHAIRHLIGYSRMRWPKRNGLRSKPNKQALEKLKLYLIHPLNIISEILQFLTFQKINVFKELIQILSEHNSLTEAYLNKHINSLLEKLEKRLTMYHLFDPLKFDKIKNDIPTLDISYPIKTECHDSLTEYFQVFSKAIQPLDFKISYMFELSKKKNWELL